MLIVVYNLAYPITMKWQPYCVKMKRSKYYYTVPPSCSDSKDCQTRNGALPPPSEMEPESVIYLDVARLSLRLCAILL